LVTFDLKSNFNTHAIRSKDSKESREKIQKRSCKKEGPSIKEKMETLNLLFLVLTTVLLSQFILEKVFLVQYTQLGMHE